MNWKNPKIKLYLIIFSSIALLAIFIFGAIIPLINKINALSQKHSEIRQEIANITEKRNQIAKIEAEYSEIKDSIAQIDGSLADQSKFLEILIRLEKMAEQSGNKHEITVIDSAKIKKESSGFNHIAFRVILRGGFANIAGFINLLENDALYSQIDKIEIAKIEESPQTADLIKSGFNLKATLELKMFTR